MLYQGNRGTGEQGKPNASRSGRRASPTEPDPAPAVVTVAPATDLVLVRSDDPPITAQTLVATWIDHCRARPPSNVIGQIAKHCAALLAEGIDPDAIEAGLAAWHAKGLHPSTLPSVVNEVLNPPTATNGTAHSRERQRMFNRWDEIAAAATARGL